MAFSVKRSNILILSVITGIVTTAQYALLGESGTVFLTAISLLYALGLCFAHKIPIVESKKVAGILMVVFTVGFFAINGVSLSWGLVSYTASLIGAFMLLFKNQLVLKWMMLANGLAWGTFQLASGAYGQLPGEALFIAGVVFSLCILHRAKSQGKSLESIPELSSVIKDKLLRRNQSPIVASNIKDPLVDEVDDKEPILV